MKVERRFHSLSGLHLEVVALVSLGEITDRDALRLQTWRNEDVHLVTN